MNIYEKTECSFPHWSDFPDVGLYMDQVVELVNKYLSDIPAFAGADKQITSSMINNYVKSKAVPAPEKKRYTRIHLAYIMIVCTLKQTFNISVIKSLLNNSANEDDIRTMYDSFADYQQESYSRTAHEILDTFNSSTDKHGIILQLVTDVNIRKNIAELLSRESEQTDQ